MTINTAKEPEEEIEEIVKEGIGQETDIYKYLGMVINKSGNLEDHILELSRQCEVINREIVQQIIDTTDVKSSMTPQSMLECQKVIKLTLSRENRKGEWEEILEIYRNNKNKKELAVIKLWNNNSNNRIRTR